MNSFLALLLAIVAAANEPAQPADTPTQAKPKIQTPDKAVDPNDPVEKEYQKLLTDDDAALTEVNKWIEEADAFAAKGGKPPPPEILNAKIEQRLQPILDAYRDFLRRHPNHARAHLAFGSFLYEIQEEAEAVVHWEKAKELDPNEPAAWNNLANFYGHRGPVIKAFEYYEKAIQLDPAEPVYLQNLATTTYLFRVDARAYYKCTEEEVFNRALELYRRAIKLDPDNLILATDYAMSYYGIKPLRTEPALAAWKYALKVAKTEFEKQMVYLHLARVELNSGMFKEARDHLALVTDPRHSVLKERLLRNLENKEKPQKAPEQKEVPAAPKAVESRR